MNSLQRFYHWIANSPALLETTYPITDFAHLPVPALESSVRYNGNPRLGFVYQHLVNQVLLNSKRYSIELEEIQLNDSGRTLGAIDMIVKDKITNKLEHWEVAIKFYLLHQGTWYGPNAHDQLDKKLERMLNHQLNMSDSKPFVEQFSDYIPDEKRLLLQGRLYVNPFDKSPLPTHCKGYQINPSQISGFWCYHRQWAQIDEPLYQLEKVDWAAGSKETSQLIDKPTGRFCHAISESGKFWFVVNDQWPNDTNA
ncbi:DUF1853 family protein [Vibrio sonorensis]|uniref:DUF1853 family protein n=1 Tax=Vibrio sonorensis TaxID=1004316 RepID=UPI0008DAF402|nr:DUF1853 family protein [Vibrio sonorensis]